MASMDAPRTHAPEACARCTIDVYFGPVIPDPHMLEVSKSSSARHWTATKPPKPKPIATATTYACFGMGKQTSHR